MPRAFTLVKSAAVSALIFPTTVWADVTADDVWQNTLDYSAAFGGTLIADLSRNGATVAVSDMTYTLDLPLEAGTVTVSLGSAEMKENGNGTVDWVYPDALTYRIAYAGSKMEDFTAEIQVTHEGMTMVASGTPDDIVYDWQADRIDYSVGRFPLPEGFELTAFTGSVLDMVGQVQLSVGKLVTIQSSYEAGEQTFEMVQNSVGEDGFAATTYLKDGSTSMKGTSEISLPRGGMSILNLSTALRDGLSVVSEMEFNGYHTEEISEVNGATVMTQVATAETYAGVVIFDENGLNLLFPSEKIQIEMEVLDPLRLAFSASADSAFGVLRMPILKDEKPSKVALGLDMQGVTLDETLWAMFDPEQMLDRTAANFKLDLRGTATNNVEWLDFLNVESAFQSLAGLPVDMHDLEIATLNFKAAGAEVTGNGAVTFDNTDLVTYPGFPRPDGRLEFDIKGANGILDTLVMMGLMPEQDISGFRMILAMMTTPVDNDAKDHLTSTIEMTPEGHVLANGNRLK